MPEKCGAGFYTRTLGVYAGNDMAIECFWRQLMVWDAVLRGGLMDRSMFECWRLSSLHIQGECTKLKTLQTLWV